MGNRRMKEPADEGTDARSAGRPPHLQTWRRWTVVSDPQPQPLPLPLPQPQPQPQPYRADPERRTGGQRVCAVRPFDAGAPDQVFFSSPPSVSSVSVSRVTSLPLVVSAPVAPP